MIYYAHYLMNLIHKKTKKINRKPFDYSIYSDNFEIRNTNNKNNIQK